MEVSRQQRVALIEHELEIGEEGSDGFRPISHGTVEVGLPVQSAPSRWRLQWRLEEGERWREDPSEVEARSREAAEAWAVHELATLLAMKDESELRSKRSSG